jgi:hypothetical protein
VIGTEEAALPNVGRVGRVFKLGSQLKMWVVSCGAGNAERGAEEAAIRFSSLSGSWLASANQRMHVRLAIRIRKESRESRAGSRVGDEKRG